MYCKLHGKNCNGDCKDPNIDNGMMTKVWGPPGWLFLHCISFGYPYYINDKNKDHINKRKDYKNFFNSLGYVLPCKYCRESYIEFIKETPIDKYLNSRKDLTKWLYIIHKKVNDKLGIPECQMPGYNEMTKVYEAYRAKCKKTTSEERENNLAKGCVTPADGTPRKCFLKVIECNKGDVTRRNSNNNNIMDNDYILLKKNNMYIVIFFIIILLILIFVLIFDRKILKKLNYYFHL